MYYTNYITPFVSYLPICLVLRKMCNNYIDFSMIEHAYYYGRGDV